MQDDTKNFELPPTNYNPGFESLGSGVPEFTGEDFAADAKKEVEAPKAENVEASGRSNEIADASLIMNYGLGQLAYEVGVAPVVEAIKANTTGKVRDIYLACGIDTIPEMEDTIDEGNATAHREAEFRNESENAPSTRNASPEGEQKAIMDFKRLIGQVETAEPYAGLRAEAQTMGMDVWSYAVYKNQRRGLPEFFNELTERKKEYEAGLKSAATEEAVSETEEKVLNDVTDGENNKEAAAIVEEATEEVKKDNDNRILSNEEFEEELRKKIAEEKIEHDENVQEMEQFGENNQAA